MPSPSRSTRHRLKKTAEVLGNEDSANLSTDTSSSSSRSDEQPRKRQRTVDEGRLDQSHSAENSGEEEPNSQSDGAPDADNVEVHSDHDSHQEESGDEMEQEYGDADDEGEIEDEDEIGEGEEHDIGIHQGEELLEQQPADDIPHDNLLDDRGAASSSSESSSSDDEGEDQSESDSSSEEEEEEDPHGEAADGDVPLYPNARITLMESLVMILTLSLRFSLSGECIAHILELIEMHCPANNVCKRTLYRFKNYFVEIGRKNLILHYYCDHCMSELESKDSVCARCDNSKVAFFIQIPLLDQLQRLFLRPGFVEKLSYRFNRVKKHDANYEDIYDGNLYKEQMRNGFLSHAYNISLMWYTDGIKIFKSSTYSVWPLFFAINELRYKDRTDKENVLLCGLWFGKSKPKPNLFLKPFRETFETFKNDGFIFNVPQGNPVRVRGILLCGACDLQAKCLFLRTKLYNGYYGCAKCYSKGQRAQAGRTTVHVHPFNPAVRLRQNNEVFRCAQLAHRQNAKSVLGIKGLSILYFLMPDMIRGTSIDIMHLLFLGICKQLTKFWFDTKFSGELFSCSAMIDTVNERLLSIRPPSFVQRITRSLSELKEWKAKEFKLWFFNYSIPSLIGILPNEYLFHHMKLVTAISLLSQESVFPEQIDRAETLLLEYVRDFQRLYGLRFMGMNVHLLTHLAQAVRDLGPLWVYSCFFYEDLNGQLVKLIHGPYLPGIQIMSSAALFMSLNLQLEKLQPNSVAKQFCIRMRQVGSKFTTAEIINAKSCVVGKNAFRRNVPVEIVNIIRQQQQVAEGGNFVSFYTLRKKGVFFDSAQKPQSRNRCSKYVMCDNNGVPVLGEISHFVRWSLCNCNNVCACLPAVYFCVVKLCERTVWLVHEVPNVSLFHLSAVQPTDQLLVVTCDQIICTCFYVNVGIEYLAVPINSLEYE